MSDVLTTLRDRRTRVWEQAKSLADHAAEQNRAFSDTEEASWTAFTAELKALDKRMAALLEGEQRATAAQDAHRSLFGDPGTGPPFARIGRSPRYLRRDVRAWSSSDAKATRSPAAAPGAIEPSR